MSFTLMPSHFYALLGFILLFLCPSLAATTGTSPDTLCPSTPHPDFCHSILPRTKPGAVATIHDYGRFCITHSMSYANNFLSLVNDHIVSGSSSGQYSVTTLRALEDCQFLASLNVDFLSSTMDSIRDTNTTLPASEASLVNSILSAVMTNLETCSGGLIQATGSSSSVVNDLAPFLTNGTLLSSVSLALVTQGWGFYGPRGRLLSQHDQHQYQYQPVFPHRKARMSSSWPPLRLARSHHDKNHARPLRVNHISGARKGRRLLQVGGLDVQVNSIVTVDPSGYGNFTTISDAVAAAPNNTKANSGYFVIHVVAGVYEEYVSIPSSKKYLLMVGDGINRTIITGNHSVVDGWTTFNSPTFAVVAQGFIAVGITFRNTAGAIKQQAVAVRNGADLSTFYSCSFEAYQDTLYAYSLRQFYKQCDIYGTVDFIFGNAAVVFQDCNIYPRQPIKGQFNTITAQGRTDPNQNTGTSIQGGVITAAADLAASNFTVETYLGRPWKNYSRTVFIQSYMDSLINPAGWHEWSGTFALDTLYYAEYDNTGPGSNTTDRVTWLGYHIINTTVAEEFTVSNFISGDNWLPATGVDYTGGLL